MLCLRLCRSVSVGCDLGQRSVERAAAIHPRGHIVGFLWLGVFVNAIGYLLWALALQGSSAAAISNFDYGTPAIAMLLSHFFLGEPMYITSILGLALILAGFFL